MPRSAWIAVTLLALAVLAGCAAPTPPPQPSPQVTPEPPPPPPPPSPPAPPAAASDQEFVDLVLSAGNAEIGMARLARGKAQARDIRELAGQLMPAWTGANARLTTLANHLMITPSPAPDQPPPELLISLGAEFDKQYIAIEVKALHDLVGLFEGEESGGQDARMMRYAREMLPALRRQLQEAEAIGQRLGA